MSQEETQIAAVKRHSPSLITSFFFFFFFSSMSGFVFWMSKLKVFWRDKDYLCSDKAVNFLLNQWRREGSVYGKEGIWKHLQPLNTLGAVSPTLNPNGSSETRFHFLSVSLSDSASSLVYNFAQYLVWCHAWLMFCSN